MKRVPFAVAVLLLSGLIAVSKAGAEELVVALSTDHVQISSSFTGTGLAVFGAIESEPADPRPYEVVVVVRGPPETVVTRRKERIAGVWLNRTARDFLGTPSFYAVESSRPLGEIATDDVLATYGIGFPHIDFGERANGPTGEDAAFRESFVRLKRGAGLFRHEDYGVTFPGSAAFLARIDLPANVPVGSYRVSVFLFQGGRMLTTNGADFQITKTGFEQFTFDLAHRYGYLYGLVVVLLALVTGWLAGLLFRRD